MAEKKEKKAKKEKSENPGGKSNLIIIALLVLILIGIGSFAGFYFYQKSKSATPETKVVVKVEQTYLELGEYTVNLSDDKEKHYLKAKLSVGYDKTNKKLGTEATEDLIALQSTALEYLQSKKAEDFKSTNLENVKKELIDNLNKRVSQGQFIEAYFQELIVQ